MRLRKAFFGIRPSTTGGKRRRAFSRISLLLLGSSVAALAASPVFAGDTWSGNSSANWSDNANWSSNAPANGDDVTIAQGSSITTFASSNFDYSVTLNSLTLNPTNNTATKADGYVINNAGSFTLGLESGGSITDNATNAVSDQINTGITLNGPATITVSSGATGLTIGGTGIVGTGGLTVSNSGTNPLLFTANNTYTGGTTITTGTLQLGDGGTTGSIVGNVTDNGKLAFDRSDNITFSGNISGTGSVTQMGGGVLTLSGTNLYSGGTKISSGTVSVSADANLGAATGAITIAGGATLQATAGFATSRNIALTSGTATIDTVSGPNPTLIVNGTISGSGGLDKTGDGALILTANNTYSGGTTISAGILQLGAAGGGTTGSVQGNIVDDGQLIFNRTDSITLNSTISGTGSVTKNFGGTLMVLANQTYTGGTIVEDGTLQLGNGGTSGMVAGTPDSGTTLGASITLAATTSGVVFDHSNAVTYAGDITGAGLLVQEDGNTLTLTGSDFYTGGTTIDSGSTLQVGNGGTAGSITGAISDNGHFIVDLDNPTTGTTFLFLNGIISGSGSLTQEGTGTTIIGATDSYSGGTTISGGVLQIGDGGTAGSVSGDITDNATLDFDRKDTLTYGGAITGTGAVEQTGTGTTILTGISTYSGGTTISGGILQIGAGATGSIAGDVTDNATLDFDRSNSLSFSGVISGTGIVEQIGGGTLTLSGDNTYSGGTNISNGTLAVSDVTNLGTGQVTITNGAALEFTGTSTFTQALSLGTGGGTLDTNSETVTWSGPVGGATGDMLTVNGGGTLILTGSDGSAGGTTIASATTLQVGNGGSTGAISGDITDNGTLDFDRSGLVSNSGVISGSGLVEQSGGGTLTLSGTNTYTGGTDVNAGTLSISSDANLGNGGTLAMAAGTTLDVTTSGTFTHAVTLTGDPTFNIAPNTTTVWSGLISDGSSAGTLNITGGGTFNPTNASNSYSGGTVVSGNSTLEIASDGVLGAPSGGLTLGDAGMKGTLSVMASFTSGRTVTLGGGGGEIDTASSNSFEISNGIGGTGALTVGGAGTLVLAGNSTYSGGTTISTGSTLQLGDATNAGNITGNVSNNGELLFEEGGATVTFAGAVTGAGSLTQDDVHGGIVILTGANTYIGGTTITAGTLQLGNGTTPGSVVGNITDNSALVFDEGGNTTFGSIVSGTGSLTQDDTSGGTLILTNANTYTGGTTVSAGTLQIGNGGTSGAIVGNVNDNATLAFDRSDVVTFGGAISGSGAVVQMGSGTTILTNANTYSGGTTITAGTLQLGNGTTAGSVQGNITDNSALVFDEGGNATFNGIVSGSGSLTQNDTSGGTLTLTNANTYTGGTTITAGTLQLGNGATPGSVQGNIADNSAVVFDEGGNATYAGNISGTGTLTQNDTSGGTLILTGSNTYSGGTTITAGTLQIGNGGTTGSLSGNVSDGTALAFDLSNTSTFGGTITGGGSVAQIGTGTTILTGDNSYGGGTTISAGALQIGNGGTTGSIAGDVTDNGSLTFDRSDDISVGGAITGSGGVEQNGTGALTLTGTDSYSGATSVNSGTLLVNGSINNSTVTANSGGVVGGIGSIGGLTVAGGGTVSPGVGGPGTLNVAGNATLSPNSTYLFDATPTSSDLLNVSGTASVAGALNVNATGFTASTTSPIPIIEASGGLSGTFSSVSVSSGTSGLVPLVNYTNDEATLTLLEASSLPSSTVKGNQGQVASAIDFAIVHDNAIAFVPITSLSGQGLTNTLAEMSGEVATGVQTVDVNAMSIFLETMLDPSVGDRGGLGDGGSDFALRDHGTQVAYNGPAGSTPYGNASQRTWTFWGAFEGGTSTADGDATLGIHKLIDNQFGGEMGFDYRPSNGMGALGIALGVNQEKWNLADNLGKGTATAYQVGLYYSRRWGGYYFSSGFAYAQYHTTTDRALEFNGATDLYHADFTPWSEALRVEAGHVFALSDSQLTPYVRFQAEDLGVPHYMESTLSGSPSFALTYTSKEHFDYSTELGSEWDTVVSASGDNSTDFHARLGWLHDFAGQIDNTATFSQFSGTSFVVTGARPSRDAAHLQLGIEEDIKNVALTLNADGALGREGDSYGGTAAVSYRW